MTRSTYSLMRVLLSLLIVAALAGCGEDDSFNFAQTPSTAFDPALAARLQARLDDSIVQSHTLGSVASAQTADGALWFGVSGFNAPDQKTALRTSDRFRIASITKMFTATLVMQLVEEGRLRLEDTLDTWYPSFPGAPQITIRNLLSHTSGIADYFSRVSLRRHYEPDAVIEIAAAAGLLFPPGTQFSYANTNYFLLARIIEKIVGSSYLVALRSRLLDPLQLAETFLEGQEEIPGGFVRGGLSLGGRYVDVTETTDPSLLWAAGGLVSTAADLLRWSGALFGRRAVPMPAFVAMTTPTGSGDGFEYGFGVWIIQTTAGSRYGHVGRTNGFTSTLFTLPSRGLTLVTLCNTSGAANSPGNAEVIADDLWQVLTPD